MSIQEIDRTAATARTHPLDPLSRNEVRAAVSVLKSTQAQSDSFRFVQVELKEPTKRALRGDLSQIRREASAVLIDRSTGCGYEATIDLENESVERWVELPKGVQPPIMLDEFEECEVNCKRDPRRRRSSGRARADRPGSGLHRAVVGRLFRQGRPGSPPDARPRVHPPGRQ